jgi:hypothetical protein
MYRFPTINVSDHSVLKVHTFWGRGVARWPLFMGMKQVEPPYLYGYGVRAFGAFVGVCRERNEPRPLVRELDIDTEEILEWR